MKSTWLALVRTRANQNMRWKRVAYVFVTASTIAIPGFVIGIPRLRSSVSTPSRAATGHVPQEPPVGSLLIWHAPEPMQPPLEPRSDSAPELKIIEVRERDGWLYLFCQYVPTMRRSQSTASNPAAALRADGAMVAPPHVDGVIADDQDKPSWVRISTKSLPTGELDLLLTVFGAQTTMAFFNAGNKIIPLKEEDRRDYKSTPLGITARGGTDVKLEVLP